MNKKIYAVIDIETTGGRPDREKITEIAIVLFDGEKIIDSYETLINPERTIPANITQITGITDTMVKDAPKFYEVAKTIIEYTENTVFVAHNVRFDYNFIREEFKQLGYTFTRKKLCTVRLSKRAFPDIGKYSLGRLIHHFGIKVNARHRAMADASATVELLKRIFQKESQKGLWDQFINLNIKESKLPASITMEDLHNFPEECGVYYMHNEKGDVVYVGKSKNIQKRIMEHFSQDTPKSNLMYQTVRSISYELTGNELTALLLESHEIKRISPWINKAQRSKTLPYAIFKYKTEAGYKGFDFFRASKKNLDTHEIVGLFPSKKSALGRLKRAIEDFELCQDINFGKQGEKPCFHYQLNLCKGPCAAAEPVEWYNARVEKAADQLSIALDGNFAIIDRGLAPQEKSIVLVERGQYRGFGYIDQSTSITSMEDALTHIKSYNNTPDTIRIIRRYLATEKAYTRIDF